MPVSSGEAPGAKRRGSTEEVGPAGVVLPTPRSIQPEGDTHLTFPGLRELLLGTREAVALLRESARLPGLQQRKSAEHGAGRVVDSIADGQKLRERIPADTEIAKRTLIARRERRASSASTSGLQDRQIASPCTAAVRTRKPHASRNLARRSSITTRCGSLRHLS